MAHVAGLVAAGLYPSPIAHADVVTTTTHKTLRGPRGGLILARANDEITKKLSSLVFPGTQGGPLMHVIAAKAVALLEALQPEFRDYQHQVLGNARAMAARLAQRGYQIVSGGTDNHLFLLSLADRNITGKEADAALGRANITVNKNAVPNDPRPADGHERTAPGYAGLHYARLQAAGDRAGGRLHRPGARRGRRRGGDRTRAPAGDRTVPPLPGVRTVTGPSARAAHALSVLRPRRDQGERLAPGG